METSSNFERAAASKARLTQERIQESNARVYALRYPGKTHYLAIALSFAFVSSLIFAGISFVKLGSARAELTRVEQFCGHRTQMTNAEMLRVVNATEQRRNAPLASR